MKENKGVDRESDMVVSNVFLFSFSLLFFFLFLPSVPRHILMSVGEKKREIKKNVISPSSSFSPPTRKRSKERGKPKNSGRGGFEKENLDL